MIEPQLNVVSERRDRRSTRLVPLRRAAVAVIALIGGIAFFVAPASAATASAPSLEVLKAGTSLAPAFSEETYADLRAVNSAKCMDVKGAGIGNGVPIIQWTCLGPNHTNQLWKLHRAAIAGDGTVLFQVIAYSNNCLDVRGGPGATGDGVPIQQWTCIGINQTNQLWSLGSYDGFVTFNLRPWHSDKCLDVTGGPGAIGDGIPLQQWTCLGPGQTNQFWYQATP